jgi:putative nucleotidyltransferase with HDIG domain
MLDREEALKLVKSHVKNDKLIKHMLAVEAIMKKTAEFLGEDKEKWALLGLIHDVDYEYTCNDTNKHTIVAEDILKGRVTEEIIRAIKSHGYWYTKIEPQSKMEHCLVAADALSGLIIACALVMPSKKLKDVRVESISKRFKKKDFARNCNREGMLFCEKAGVEKENFFGIALKALQEVAGDLGL